METNNKKMGYFYLGGFCILFFFLGYLVYPQINTVDKGMHKMPDGAMMRDMDPMTHQGMSMGQMMKAMTVSLQGKTDEKFDEAFLEEMIPHHQGAVEMARMVLTSTKRPELIKLANEIIEAQQKEIVLMREWQKKWFGIQPE